MTNTHCRFTIVTPSFNRAHLLPRCIESVLAQTHSDFELIIVDDGSNDDTAETLGTYTASDPRVRYFRQEKRGANAARNHGVRHAVGEYVLVLDSDDEALPNWLESLDRLICETGGEICCCGIEFLDEHCRSINVILPKHKHDGVFRSGTYAVRRDVHVEAGGFAESLPAHQHTEFRFRLEKICERHSYSIASIPSILVRANTHDGPKIRSDASAKLAGTKYILARYQDRFEGPGALASWLAAAGGCAAELGNYSEARQFFAEAVRTNPKFWKNYARCGISSLPFIRNLFWRKTGIVRK